MNYYIHVPFCASKCGYCVFYSESSPSEERIGSYFDKLFPQLERAGEGASTIYIGGGTPTLPDCGQLERFLEKVHTCLNPAEDAEISIEANPETLTPEKVKVLRRYVTRISTGVQSFFSEARTVLGRKCSQASLEKALALVAEAAFPHWNCDLIYAIPGRSIADWEKEFDILEKYPVDHLSCYSLTREEGAALYGSLLPDEDISADLEEITQKRLAERGIFRYEVSNYAFPGCECRHNVNVWRGGLLKGYGPSAAGFDGRVRMTEPADLDAWLAGKEPEIDLISPQERLNEIFAVNLRTVAGWSRELWQQVPFCDSWQKRLALAHQTQQHFPGFFEITEESIRLTPGGLAFWDFVAEELLV